MVNNWSFFNLLGQYCPICGGSISRSTSGLCAGCYRELPWLRNVCHYCANPLPGGQYDRCGACMKQTPPYQSICLFQYQHPVDKLIGLLKYHQQLYYGRLFGNLLVARIASLAPPFYLPQAIIPIPLHRKRLQLRGYNQSYEIASHCSDQLNLPLLDSACERIINTPPQSGLDAKTRQRNLKSAFRCCVADDIKSVAIVDDVMTTGATATALTNSLIQAGVKEIQIWCIARTAIE